MRQGKGASVSGIKVSIGHCDPQIYLNADFFEVRLKAFEGRHMCAGLS